jgi:hypothetical protein
MRDPFTGAVIGTIVGLVGLELGLLGLILAMALLCGQANFVPLLVLSAVLILASALLGVSAIRRT